MTFLIECETLVIIEDKNMKLSYTVVANVKLADNESSCGNVASALMLHFPYSFGSRDHPFYNPKLKQFLWL